MIDLHTHSTCSDGSERPGRVVELASAAGCSALALTDHDGLAGIAEARRRAGELGIELIAGCEVSCRFEVGSMHMLCYFVEDTGSVLAAELGRLRDDRDVRNERLLDRLAGLGITLCGAELAEEAGGGVIGRPHFAALLVRHGHASSSEDAFERLLGKGGAAYVAKARLEPAGAIALVADSGGTSAVAHPLSLGLDPTALGRVLGELSAAGLTGVECYYGRYDPGTRAELVALARRHGLVPTGGSDFHGRYKPDLAVGSGTGDLQVPDDVIPELAARRRPARPGRNPSRAGG